MYDSDDIRSLVGRQSLMAVFDESGSTSRPGLDDDFALGSVIFRGRPAVKNLLALDKKLQEITNKKNYKYKHIRKNVDCRRAVIDALNRQSGLIRLFGYFASAGAFVAQAQRELRAVKTMGGNDAEVAQAELILHRARLNPKSEGLKDALHTSIPAMSSWASRNKERIKVFMDARTDMLEISNELGQHMSMFEFVRIFGDAYDYLDWEGNCPKLLYPVSRIADVVVGDIRTTFLKHGDLVWNMLEQDGFVGRHDEVSKKYVYDPSSPIPLPLVGKVSHGSWDTDWNNDSAETTMFGGYRDWIIGKRIPLYSPSGIGCHLVNLGDEYLIFQQMD